MSRILPRSLGGQLVALLLAGLVLSQVLTFLVVSEERRKAIRAAHHFELVERTASIVRVLEEIRPERRDDILAAIGSRWLRLWITDDSALDASDRGDRALALASALDEMLPDGGRAPARVHLADGDEPGMPWHQRAELQESEATPRGGRPYRVDLTLSVPLADGGWLNVTTQSRRRRIGGAWPPLVSILLMAGAILVVVALTVRRITRPLTALSTAADRLGRGETVEPLPETGPLEVRRSTAAFNAMQTRLTRFVRDRTAMLAAISHDLRTPITSMRIRAELVEDEETRTKLLESLDEMQRMTEAALTFAREEAAREETRVVDLAALVESLCEDLAEMGLAVTFAGADKTPYPCRPLSLKRAIRNLVENAVRYGRRAGVALEQARDELLIIIDDDGPGIPEAEAERVFAPFVRLEESRSRETGGIGLGLAIARSIVRGHGGDISLENRREGGLRATIYLPSNGTHAVAGQR